MSSASLCTIQLSRWLRCRCCACVSVADVKWRQFIGDERPKEAHPIGMQLDHLWRSDAAPAPVAGLLPPTVGTIAASIALDVASGTVPLQPAAVAIHDVATASAQLLPDRAPLQGPVHAPSGADAVCARFRFHVIVPESVEVAEPPSGSPVVTSPTGGKTALSPLAICRGGDAPSAALQLPQCDADGIVGVDAVHDVGTVVNIMEDTPQTCSPLQRVCHTQVDATSSLAAAPVCFSTPSLLQLGCSGDLRAVAAADGCGGMVDGACGNVTTSPAVAGCLHTDHSLPTSPNAVRYAAACVSVHRSHDTHSNVLCLVPCAAPTTSQSMPRRRRDRKNPRCRHDLSTAQ